MYSIETRDQLLSAFASLDLTPHIIGAIRAAGGVGPEVVFKLGETEALVTLGPDRADVAEISLLNDGRRLFWISLWGKEGRSDALTVLKEACAQQNPQIVLDYYRNLAEQDPELEAGVLTASSLVQDQRARVRRAIVSQGLSTGVLPPLEEVPAKLRSVPFMSQAEFCTFVSPAESIHLTRNVPLNRFVGTSQDSDWTLDNDRGDSYIYKLAFAIKEGNMWPFSEAEPIGVELFEGLHFITINGRHRVAALKLLGQSGLEIPVTIEEATRYAVHVYSFQDYQELERRLKSRLWEGVVLQEPVSRKHFGTDFYAAWNVTSYQHPWVFARDMAQAETFYKEFTKAKAEA
ncbi:MAG: hypothetical protein K1X83_15620 [Oligoflexia bacterium]|nr:hypothetical protein [Oligoflexia bacterium]